MGVILCAHSAHGQSHIQRIANREVTTQEQYNCNGARAITHRDKFDKRIDKVQGNFLGGKHLSNGCEMTPRSNAKGRPESKHITPRSVKTREALLWSKGLGVGTWQTKTFLSLGIMMVRFPGLKWHRRAKVPLHNTEQCIEKLRLITLMSLNYIYELRLQPTI